jgi:membrane protease YdiL (CAAX protease family)
LKEFFLSSSDNPQFEPQPLTAPEPAAPPTGEFSQAGSGVPDHAFGEQPLLPTPPPPRDPVWSGWDVLLLTLLAIIILIVAEFATVTTAWVILGSHKTFRDLVQLPVLDLLGELLAYIAIAVVMVMMIEGKYRVGFWRAIRWNWPSSSVKVLGFALLGMFTISLDLLSKYLPMPKSTPFDQLFSHPRDAYLIAAFAVTVGPFMEELFFRGFLYPVLARRTGVPLAILLTALPFGLLHYVQYKSWAAVLIITLVGIVLATVRAATNSVGASFVVHVGYNATLMMLVAMATDGFRHMEKIGTAAFSL